MTPEYPDGDLPPNVTVGENTRVTGGRAFKSFKGTRPEALVIGRDGTLDGCSFAVGPAGRMSMGDGCYFTGAVLLAEESLTIGNGVQLGWNTAIADSDFRPIEPAARIADTVACSNLGGGRPRPPVAHRPVVIEDDVYVGPMATILKGVRVGAGSFVEPGSLVTRNVPPNSRVMGNPGRVVGPTTEPAPEVAP